MGTILKKIIQKTKADAKLKKQLDEDFIYNFNFCLSPRQAKEIEKEMLQISKDLKKLIKYGNQTT